jgi:hypothetical protein
MSSPIANKSIKRHAPCPYLLVPLTNAQALSIKVISELTIHKAYSEKLSLSFLAMDKCFEMMTRGNMN